MQPFHSEDWAVPFDPFIVAAVSKALKLLVSQVTCWPEPLTITEVDVDAEQSRDSNGQHVAARIAKQPRLETGTGTHGKPNVEKSPIWGWDRVAKER